MKVSNVMAGEAADCLTIHTEAVCFINLCTAGGILGYHSNNVEGRVVSYDINKQILDNPQMSSVFALAYHDALLLFIFSHFHVYMIENKPFEKGETYHFFT